LLAIINNRIGIRVSDGSWCCRAADPKHREGAERKVS